MSVVVPLIMLAWIPVVLALFGRVGPMRAALIAPIAAWLFLPVVGFPLMGLPDYTKTTSTTMGLLLGMLIFDSARLLGLRPHWIDLPMLAWCLCPFASSVSNGLGVYDGLSGSVDQCMTWGLPYLVGKSYFGDLDGLRQLATGIIVGGLVYIPLCLWEIRMSPQLHATVYGFNPHSFAQTMRYGGYRPQVFMQHGLEVGMWMAAASLAGFWLWATGTIRRVWGVGFGHYLLALTMTTILCKSTGTLVLLAAGVAIFIAIKWSKSRIPVLILLAITPLYSYTRATGLWSGSELVSLSRATVGVDREQSLQFRLDNENMLISKALQRPLFGWGGWGRARVYDEQGRDISITDGLWIIALGNHGFVGLVSINMFMLMPLALLLWRYPVCRWLEPNVAPTAVLAVLIALYSIDCLMNGMINPIYTMVIGGLTALGNRRPTAGVDLRDAPDTMEGAREDENLLLDAVQLQSQRVLDHPEDSEHSRDLALSYEALGRFLKNHGRVREAQMAWNHALDLWTELTTQFPACCEYRNNLADGQNNMAWLLASSLDVENRNPSIAVQLAQSIVESSPERAAYWNTLGAAHYRAGDYPAAIEALERSIELSSESSGFDLLLLAMAYWRRGDKGRARSWYKSGESAIQATYGLQLICTDLHKLYDEATVLISHDSRDDRDEVRERLG
ncbi:tetratricopeptide repeat protein [Singulisphaera sp. Ch08]|uniref:Tetratricopeptide repeat protein n=1 Tax=Singulisphaera sp. Ch08 TaxID=3120278 RepID=A0AAU7CDQ3_9BACT